MKRPDAEVIALLKIALRNLVGSLEHARLPNKAAYDALDYAVEVLKEVDTPPPNPAEPAQAAADTYLDTLRAQGLSPTGRHPSQPEFQSLRPSTRPMWNCPKELPDTTTCFCDDHEWTGVGSCPECDETWRDM